MTQQPETDAEDVTQWFLIERETHPQALAGLIVRFPQSEQQIREVGAFCETDETLPGRELRPEDESHAVAIGRGVVKAMIAGQRMGRNEAPSGQRLGLMTHFRVSRARGLSSLEKAWRCRPRLQRRWPEYAQRPRSGGP